MKWGVRHKVGGEGPFKDEPWAAARFMAPASITGIATTIEGWLPHATALGQIAAPRHSVVALRHLS